MWLRRAMIGIAALAVIAAVFIGFVAHLRSRLDATTAPNIGGRFELTDALGRKVTDKELLGKPTAIYFGYTYCPEACPTTLMAMTNWIRDLGSQADKMNFVFVTIDPQRDTPAQLKLYLTSFDPHIRGFTGTPAEVAKVAHEYGVYYQKIPSPDGTYLLDHSTVVYLLDRRGKFVGVIPYQDPPAQAESQLRVLIG